MIVSRVRQEEKLLLGAYDEQGIEIDVINDGGLVLDPISPDLAWLDYDLVLQRSVSTSRTLHTLQVLETWGVPTLNNHAVSSICADKLSTSLALAKAGIPQPSVRFAFTPEATLKAIEELGYPVVLKPTTGSWGRLLARVNDRHAAESVLEHRQVLGNFPYHTQYVQAFIEKPEGRDIRAFVLGDETLCAIYRSSSHWITNTSQGGKASNCPITPELYDLCRQTSAAIGGGILAIDLFETEQGLLVNEVNHNMEFRNSIDPTGVDIPARIVSFTQPLVAKVQEMRERAR
jgi:[lysine-biosynthesis-protein LysW]--L-2-aminoadipate ligase